MNLNKLPPHSFELCNNKDFQRHEWIWWVFSLYYFIPVFYTPFDWLKHSVMIGAYIVFIVLCIVVARTRPARVWIPISCLLLLTVATTHFTPGTSTFLTYAGFFIGFYFTVRQCLLWLGGILLLILGLQLYYQYPIPYFIFPALTGLVTVGLVGLIEQFRQRAKVKEQQSHNEIRQLAMIAERERIARDLHDILGHTLSSIALKAELAEKLLAQRKTAEAQQHLIELHKIARDSLSLVRQTVSGYKHRGLTGEVMHLCEQLRQNNFRVELEGEFPSLSARMETALILTLTELTTNVLRHSDGNTCHLTFSKTPDNIVITLYDNGITETIHEGNGLQGVRERLNALAGKLEIDLKQGTRFTITLPVDIQEKEAVLTMNSLEEIEAEQQHLLNGHHASATT
jgi:two-component system sensor histidine kinase DesK